MPQRSRLVAIGLATFVVGVILFFPARVAYRWFAPPEVTVGAISGSVWSGSASEAVAAGVYLRELQWQLQPLALLTGRLAYTIKTNLASGFLQGELAMGATGSISGRNVTAVMPLQNLQAVLPVAGLQGNLSAQFSELEIDEGLPIRLVGVVEVSRLVVPLVQRDSLGGFKAEFFTQENGIVASVEDTDAVFDLAGSLRIATDRSYEFVASLSPRANTPAAVRQQMQFLGSANERGQHELRLEGSL